MPFFIFKDGQLFHMGDLFMGGRLNNLARHKEFLNGDKLVSRHKNPKGGDDRVQWSLRRFNSHYVKR